MSERILRALMQLFAIIAHVDDTNESGENDIKSSRSIQIIESFLKVEITANLIGQYIELFNEHLNTLHQKQNRKDGEKKRTSLNSVKILRICSQINEELTQKQKVIVLIRIIEFIRSNEIVTEQEIEFVDTVAEAFNIKKDEYNLITDFVLGASQYRVVHEDVIHLCGDPAEHENQLPLEGLDDDIRVLHVKSVNLIFFRYFGKDDLNLNGQFIPNDRTHIFTQGATLRTHKSKHIYFSDIQAQFLKSHQKSKLTFKVQQLAFNFRKDQPGLRTINFIEQSGKLIGIMGGSGTGKSTFLNVLNGNIKPTSGKVTINGIDVHAQNKQLEGIIGFISQDDLLIEELTVYQNIYFNAKLCFGNLSEIELKRKVIDILYSIGLYEVKDLVVGNPLQKTISGGQRKRLNIALELIREPEVLFVDEPTSGLSSRDSENIMELLKELTFKGKLIFVVIHQPSSDIFKQFDRLFIIDKGGYPVFDGNPIDAVVYFKGHIHHSNAEERECSVCGNVNPEQIFNIIDSKIVDEYGNLTSTRKISPEEWYQKYLGYKKDPNVEEEKSPPKGQSVIAGQLRQFKVFFLRDLLAKLSNRQYILITLLEAPVLALVLSFVVKYFNGPEVNGHPTYSFFANENIPQFIFIAVVVALFLGLTVAAEEINKDKRILKREQFLNLSRNSYLSSKISIMFIISAIQAFLFVAVGNLVLEINGMWFEYWLVLFSTSCVANLMGLNISSAFDSAKVIYIIVPILIIPQLLFSGVIVRFDRLHPSFSNQVTVPVIGNLMPSRWAYEAIAVSQAAENKLELKFFEINKKRTEAAWKRDYWIPAIYEQLDEFEKDLKTGKANPDRLELLVFELNKEQNKWSNLTCKDCIQSLNQAGNSKKFDRLEIDYFLNIIKNQYTKSYNEQIDRSESLKKRIGNDVYLEMKERYTNEALMDQVSNRRESDKLVIQNNRIYRKDSPIYQVDASAGFISAPFNSPVKHLFGTPLSTFWSNIIVLWIFVSLSWIALQYDILRKLIEKFNRIKK